MIRDGRLPRKALDFAAFSQDVVARWAATLRDVLRAAGGDALVTLGQDEGGTELRPAQQLHASSVDYTAVHTWWNNDDLLWDGVVTKTPEKPNLHQETGLMRLEDTDGNPWRTPEAAARLLERKLAYAFAARGAGVVQWAWNINPYQPIDNESVIGLFRPDGTAKPELRALRELASFLEQSPRMARRLRARPGRARDPARAALLRSAWRARGHEASRAAPGGALRRRAHGALRPAPERGASGERAPRARARARGDRGGRRDRHCWRLRARARSCW